MASNITTMLCNKPVDIRYKYMNNYVDDRVVETVFVKFADSDSNILTKNFSADLHEKHSKKMVDEKLVSVFKFYCVYDPCFFVCLQTKLKHQ